jgi:aryl-alcohol dehydrogenase-like predicted oxidoreductase
MISPTFTAMSRSSASSLAIISQMRYRSLGTTGLRVSEIGFGAWGIGGNSKGAIAYGPTSDEESRRALRRAFDEGVTFFDTADFYGFGHSEELIGAALAGLRSQVVIATKVGMLDAQGAQDFSPAYIRRAAELSLRRLGTDYIDLYQLHSPPVGLLEENDGILGCMEALQREGDIRAFGMSARNPDEALTAVKKLGIKCVQVNFNLLDQRALENGLFDLCLEHSVGVIVKTPLCFGFLSGKYAPSDDFGPTDHRNRWNPAQRAKWAGAYRLFASALCSDPEQTPAQFALRFCLSFPAVSTVIPGMLTPAHVEENIRASDFDSLLDSERSAIMSIYREQEFFLGLD